MSNPDALSKIMNRQDLLNKLSHDLMNMNLDQAVEIPMLNMTDFEGVDENQTDVIEDCIPWIGKFIIS